MQFKRIKTKEMKIKSRGQIVKVRHTTKEVAKLWGVCKNCEEKFMHARKTAKFCCDNCRAEFHYFKKLEEAIELT